MKPEPTRLLPAGEFVGHLSSRRELAGFAVLDVQDDPRVDVVRHGHADAHLCILLSDGYASSACGLNDHGSRGTVIYNPASTVHSDHFVRRGGRFLAIPLAGRTVDLAHERAPLPTFATADGSPRAAARVARLLAEMHVGDAAAALEVEAIVWELLGLVAKQRRSRDRELPPWLRRAVERLRNTPANDLTVRDLADDAGVHPVSLARAFRRHLGAGPGEYLRWRRVELALQQLPHCEVPLARIALDAGFSDQTAFTRAFRKVLGTTPGAYRASVSGGRRSQQRARRAPSSHSFRLD